MQEAEENGKQFSMVDEIQVTVPKANMFGREQINLSDVIGQGRFTYSNNVIYLYSSQLKVHTYSVFDENTTISGGGALVCVVMYTMGVQAH